MNGEDLCLGERDRVGNQPRDARQHGNEPSEEADLSSPTLGPAAVVEDEAAVQEGSDDGSSGLEDAGEGASADGEILRELICQLSS